MLTSVALLFLLGFLFGAMAEKLKLPRLIGYLAAGIVLGPYLGNFIDSSVLEISGEIKQIALVIILFRAGLSLRLSDLKQAGRPALLLCFVPAVFEMIAVILIAPKLFPITVLDAAIIGSVLAAVSPAVVVPRMLKLIEQGYGKQRAIPQLLMAGASVDDVFVIVVFTSLLSLATSSSSLTLLPFLQLPFTILLGIVLGMLAGVLLSLVLKYLPMHSVVAMVVVTSSCFLLLAIETISRNLIQLPISGLLAIMSMGATILYYLPQKALILSKQFSNAWIVAELLLFAMVGVSLNISFAVSAGVAVVVLIVAGLLARMVGVLCSVSFTKLDKKERLFCMLTYTPKATVQAAIGGIPLTLGLASGNLVLTIAVVAILLCAPLGAFMIDMSYQRLLKQD